MGQRVNKRAAANSAGMSDTSALEQVLGHCFADPHQLELALTHRSFAYEAAGGAGAATVQTGHAADPRQDNEQLEFLGDAVLGMLAAESLIRHFARSREGELTRLRASVVSRKYLGRVGTRLDLGQWLRLGRTGSNGAGHASAALLANTVEALIAAVYLDGGLEAARNFIEREILGPALPQLERSVADGSTFSGAVGDFKSVLQEMLQADGNTTPEYRLIEESGPGHRRVFRIQVEVAGEPLAEAEGSSKKDAQQEAARLATAVLRERRNADASKANGRSTLKQPEPNPENQPVKASRASRAAQSREQHG